MYIFIAFIFIPVLFSLAVFIGYYLLSKIQQPRIRFLVPPIVFVGMVVIRYLFTALTIIDIFSISLLAILTPFPLFENYFKLKWKGVPVFLCAFITIILLISLGMVYTFGESTVPVEINFNLYGLLIQSICLFFVALTFSCIIYSGLICLDKIINHIGNKIH